MPTFSTLITKVTPFIDDVSLISLAGDFINQGVSEIAGGMPSVLNGVDKEYPSTITPPLPGLFTIDKVSTSTDAAYVSMPSNFQRDLQFVASSTGSEIDISESFITFAETYPLLNKSGRISEVIEHGGKLYYQGIPTASEEVTIHYYRKPVDMVAKTSTPDGIPEHLQIPLLVNFAAWKILEINEDGSEEKMLKTAKYKNLFIAALRTLELSIPSYTRGLMLR